jgi:hypothetical protein
MIPNLLNVGGYGQVPQQGASLSMVDQNQLMALSQQGNASLTHEQLLEMQGAQQGMREVAEKKNLVVPKVNFYPARHVDPRKARKQDIKQARRLLRPMKRKWLNPLRWVWGLKYRFNRNTSQCVVDGCDVEELIKYDNLYAKICDEESGRSLWDMYWKNPVTGEPEAFIARENVTDGRKMRGTYCPEHLHLYHLLCKWETQQDSERNTTKMGMKELVKKGVSTVAVPISLIKKKDNTPEFLTKYEQFFLQLEKDARTHPGISILHYQNPETKLNDVTMVVFDLRLFQKELAEIDTTLMDALGTVGIVAPPANAMPMQAVPEGNMQPMGAEMGLPQQMQQPDLGIHTNQ